VDVAAVAVGALLAPALAGGGEEVEAALRGGAQARIALLGSDGGVDALQLSCMCGRARKDEARRDENGEDENGKDENGEDEDGEGETARHEKLRLPVQRTTRAKELLRRARCAKASGPPQVNAVNIVPVIHVVVA
jgi:hypothetical protein